VARGECGTIIQEDNNRYTAGLINPYVISNVVWKPGEENKLGWEREQEGLCM